MKVKELYYLIACEEDFKWRIIDDKSNRDITEYMEIDELRKREKLMQLEIRFFAIGIDRGRLSIKIWVKPNQELKEGE